MAEKTETHPYVRLARLTAYRLLRREPLPKSGAEVAANTDIWGMERACFVSIKTLRHSLRGCIGTILPTQPSVDREIIANAAASSTRDPRFPPMRAEELDNVVFSVDVLSLPEPVSDRKELDPAVWGVIVSRGWQRGVLLPDLEGVDTVERQLEIAAQKAGLPGLDAVTIERFRVDRYEEDVLDICRRHK
jgi:AmmeMemoRadiSam system protein A